MEDDLATHRLHVSENYAKKADVKDSYEKLCRYLDEMRETINKIAVSMAAIDANNDFK